ERRARSCTLGEPVGHLLRFLASWRPNQMGLLFASRNGTPRDQNLLVKRKLHPTSEAWNRTRGASYISSFLRVDHGSSQCAVEVAAAKTRAQRSGLTLGVHSHLAQEDDVRVAAQLGIILDPSGRMGEKERVPVEQRPFAN